MKDASKNVRGIKKNKGTIRENNESYWKMKESRRRQEKRTGSYPLENDREDAVFTRLV